MSLTARRRFLSNPEAFRRIDSEARLLGAIFGVKAGAPEKPRQLIQEQRRFLVEVTDEVLATLTPREEKIIKMRFGFGRPSRTQEQVGQFFAVSRHKVREIENKALRKLRHPSRSRLLKSFLEELDRRESDEIPASIIQVLEQIERLTPRLIRHLRLCDNDLTKINFDVFEHLIAEMLASHGFQDVRLVGRNSQTHADIFAALTLDATGTEQRFFVEVKRWKRRVGIQVVHEVVGAMTLERSRLGWHATMIVTAIGFKDFKAHTQEELKLQGVTLKDREDLLRWLTDYKEGQWALASSANFRTPVTVVEIV